MTRCARFQTPKWTRRAVSMWTCRSYAVLWSVCELPKPRILPPRTDVVLNQASTEKVCGAGIAVAEARKPDELPLNEKALSVSPLIAPSRPRVTPALMLMFCTPARSKAVEPEASLNGQWPVAPSRATSCPYGRDVAPLLAAPTVAVVQDEANSFQSGSLATTK